MDLEISLEPWQQAVVDEKDALDERIYNLHKFLTTSNASINLRATDLALMNKQLHVMHEYSDILNKRIIRFN